MDGPERVRLDAERQILLTMLLAHMCSEHDATPRTFVEQVGGGRCCSAFCPIVDMDTGERGKQVRSQRSCFCRVVRWWSRCDSRLLVVGSLRAFSRSTRLPVCGYDLLFILATKSCRGCRRYLKTFMERQPEQVFSKCEMFVKRCVPRLKGNMFPILLRKTRTKSQWLFAAAVCLDGDHQLCKGCSKTFPQSNLYFV